MSAPENKETFLHRWSRKKHEASGTHPEPAEAPAGIPSRVKGEEDERGGNHAAQGSQDPTTLPQTPAVDLSALPPLESIDAQTEIGAFLRPGVPAELTRAALRRAWSADPAIRDFVGLAENAFDFNAPGVPGFGPLDPDFDVQALARRIFGESDTGDAAVPADAPSADSPQAAQLSDDSSLQAPRMLSENSPGTDGSNRPDASVTTPQEGNEARADESVAVQQPSHEMEPARTQPRRHGSALPRDRQ